MCSETSSPDSTCKNEKVSLNVSPEMLLKGVIAPETPNVVPNKWFLSIISGTRGDAAMRRDIQFIINKVYYFTVLTKKNSTISVEN